MEINLTVSNLSDAIPFYNRLLGSRPASLTYNSAEYRSATVKLLLREDQVNQPLVYYLQLHSQVELLELYDRMKFVLNKGAMSDCEVLRDRLQVADPDHHVWMVTVTGNGEHRTSDDKLSGSKCYLEPFFN